jgi:NAD(P)H dehydrogenase (quinone)
MNVLIVYAHPNPRSFNAAMREAAVDTLTEAGHAVQVSDLYAMHFKATLDEHDFKERQNPNFFDPTNEQYHAAMRGSFADDIAKEIEKVDWANLVIFQFPLWWQSFPAILKGWCDRVLANGIAVNFATYDPLLSGKKALLAFTTDPRGILTSCLRSLATCSGRLASKSCPRLLLMASARSLLMSAKWSYSAIANGCFRCDSKRNPKRGFSASLGCRNPRVKETDE